MFNTPGLRDFPFFWIREKAMEISPRAVRKGAKLLSQVDLISPPPVPSTLAPASTLAPVSTWGQAGSPPQSSHCGIHIRQS
jgi:hypothetical protein